MEMLDGGRSRLWCDRCGRRVPARGGRLYLTGGTWHDVIEGRVRRESVCAACAEELGITRGRPATDEND